MIFDPEQTKLWEDARGWAIAEILAKYHKELAEAHSRQFSRLTQRAAGYRKARGVLPWKDGDELPEVSIRRLRGG